MRRDQALAGLLFTVLKLPAALAFALDFWTRSPDDVALDEQLDFLTARSALDEIHFIRGARTQVRFREMHVAQRGGESDPAYPATNGDLDTVQQRA